MKCEFTLPELPEGNGSIPYIEKPRIQKNNSHRDQPEAEPHILLPCCAVDAE